MVIFLTSLLRTHYYDDNGRRVPVALYDENGVLTNIRKHLRRAGRLVVVANDSDDAEDNDDKIATVCESFRLAGVEFKESIMLDGRNGNNASELVSGADIVLLSGGKCVCQNKFFNRIGLKNILERYDGIVIGVSAGAMNLCATVANFPEEKSDLHEPRWLIGMGFVTDIVIPHYDGESESYQFPCDDFDIAKDYILPMSKERDFIGLPNGSYIMIDGGEKRYCGDVYAIANGKTNKLYLQ